MGGLHFEAELPRLQRDTETQPNTKA